MTYTFCTIFSENSFIFQNSMHTFVEGINSNKFTCTQATGACKIYNYTKEIFVVAFVALHALVVNFDTMFVM